MNWEKCSVIITCYNYAKYLPDCIESVLRQSITNFEIIIVNDGSTDNTDEVIRPFLDNVKIKYIRQANAGQANAKNTGISHSDGEFIAFLDADDLWETTKLQKQMPLFINSQVGVVYSKARYIDEDGKALSIELKSNYLKPHAGEVTRDLFFDNFIPFSSSIVRRECIERVGGFDETLKMGIDWDLWLRISVHYLFQFVDEPLLIYRVGHTGQMSKDLESRQACSDRIMVKFLVQNPGALTDKTIRDAYVYTYLNRGYYFRSQDIRTSLKYYIKAIVSNPIHLEAWKGLIKTSLIKLVPHRKSSNT